MIHSVRFTAVLDTNVLYPIIIRDILFWFAHYELYTPAWSKHIFDEWASVIKRRNNNLSEQEIFTRLHKANKAFPNAMVNNYESLIEGLKMRDPKDRHVLAAAIKINANVIVTQNLKDFSKDFLQKFSIEAKSPDDFICDIIDLDHRTSTQAFIEMVLNKRNPDLNEYQVLDSMRKVGLKQSADYLHSQI